jgi:hypothetical protein
LALNNAQKSKKGHLKPKQAYNMAFLLHIGCFGLKGPVLGQKALTGLKKGLSIPEPAFLNSFFYL